MREKEEGEKGCGVEKGPIAKGGRAIGLSTVS